MKHVVENEFAFHDMQVAPGQIARPDRMARFLNALKPLFADRNDPTRLAVRLRRDAGFDELDIERKKLMRAPLIR